MIRFIDRERELAYLEAEYAKKDFKFIVVYGRRRIGKTELIKNFLTTKPHIYFLCDKRGLQKNIERFRTMIEEFLKIPPLRTENFEDIFKILAEEKRKMVVCIDEFSYLIETNPEVVSIFQLIIDEVLKNKNIFLILSGSYVSLMETQVLSQKSPLYGRRTGQIFVKRIPISHLKEFFPNYSFKEIIEAYSVLDAIPGYLKFFDSKKTLLENIEETFLKPEHVLYIEPEIILREELRDPTNYLNILQAIANGCSRLTNIANSSGIPFKDLSRYLKILINLGFIEKISPVTEKKEKTKKTIYRISDNFFKFWFKFVLPYKSYIEKSDTKYVINKVKEDFNNFSSRAFENISKSFIEQEKIFLFTRIGTWWGAKRKENQRESVEIDIVALNESTKEILFAECKWQEKVNAEKLIKELKEKSSAVEWNKNNRKEYFAIFAKSFDKDYKEKNVHVIDLNTLEKKLI